MLQRITITSILLFFASPLFAAEMFRDLDNRKKSLQCQSRVKTCVEKNIKYYKTPIGLVKYGQDKKPSLTRNKK